MECHTPLIKKYLHSGCLHNVHVTPESLDRSCEICMREQCEFAVNANINILVCKKCIITGMIHLEKTTTFPLTTHRRNMHIMALRNRTKLTLEFIYPRIRLPRCECCIKMTSYDILYEKPTIDMIAKRYKDTVRLFPGLPLPTDIVIHIVYIYTRVLFDI